MLHTVLPSGKPVDADKRCEFADELDLEYALADTVAFHCGVAERALDRVKVGGLSYPERLLDIETAGLAACTAIDAFSALKSHGQASTGHAFMIGSLTWQAWDNAMDCAKPYNNEVFGTDARLGELDAVGKLVDIMISTASANEGHGPWDADILAATTVLTNCVGAVCGDAVMFEMGMGAAADRRAEMAISRKAAPILARLYALSKSLQRARRPAE